MKTINNYIHERLILSKTGKQQEITFDMLYDLIIQKNCTDDDIHFENIFPDNPIFLPKDYSKQSNRFISSLEVYSIICIGEKFSNRIIEVTQYDDSDSLMVWTAGRITNTKELYEAFEPEVVEGIYEYIKKH